MLQPANRQPATRHEVLFDESRDRVFHAESRRDIAASAEALFSHLDDHNRLSSHMSQSSWMMVGSRMDIELDADKGMAVGSRIKLKGRVLGLPLLVDEVVTERVPPLRKVWETIGSPQLLVIGPYRMGFEIMPQGAASQLRVFIDYATPASGISRWLGRRLGGFYARWCTESMAKDAARHFASTQGPEQSQQRQLS